MHYTFVSTTLGKVASFLSILFIVFVLYPKQAIVSDPSLAFDAFIWIMIAGVFGNFVMTALIYLHARRYDSLSFAYEAKYVKDLIVKSFPYGLALFLNVIYFKVDVIILSLMEPA